jgi:hypothetical protein
MFPSDPKLRRPPIFEILYRMNKLIKFSTFRVELYIPPFFIPTTSGLFFNSFGHRPFSTTQVASNPLPNHRLFSEVDWDKVDGGAYAVVDPISPGRILYLSEQDYVIMIRVSMTNNRTLKVLAAPGDTLDSDNTSSSNDTTNPKTPPLTPHPFLSEIYKAGKSKTFLGRLGRLFKSPFLQWRSTTNGEVDSMVEVTNRNVRTLINRWHDLMSWWSRGKIDTTVAVAERSSFSLTVSSLLRKNGISFTINYLKLSLFVVNSYLSGRKMTPKDLCPAHKIRIRIVNGLPAILPTYVRNGIRTRNLHTIHIWTSVLNMYKGFKGVWDMGNHVLDTIRQSHPNLRCNQYMLFLGGFSRLFWSMIQRLGGTVSPDLKVKSMFCSSKAGPNHPNVVLGAPRDASIWLDPSALRKLGIRGNLIKEWLLEVGDRPTFELFRRVGKMYSLTTSILQHVAKDLDGSAPAITSSGRTLATVFDRAASLIGGYDRAGNSRHFDEGASFVPLLGRLHALFEPAGKIRIVAIVDYWTHCVLKPLHEWLFSLLRIIPTDATFNQEGRLNEFAKLGHTTVWSIDLSSATDLIPLALYRTLFTPILGSKRTELWLELLVGRNFAVPSELRVEERTITFPTDFVRYGTGQPMGALSSWSAMAVCHHFIVQASAWYESEGFVNPARAAAALQDPRYIKEALSRCTWFMLYLILGDDLIIASKRVAERYIALAESLGIKVSLAKSYVSEEGFLNFANQSYLAQTNVSPLSFKEFIGVDSLAKRSEMVLRAVRRGWADVSATRWVAPLVKMHVTPRMWQEIQMDLSRGVTHPVVSWILSVLLVPGSAKFASSVLPRASIKSYLSTTLKKAVIWTKPLESIDSLINEWTHWAEIVAILSRAVNSLYQEFLDTRKQLGNFDQWAGLTLSPEGSELFPRIIQDQAKARLAEWELEFRQDLKTLQVLLQLTAIQPHMIEMGSGKTLDELVLILARASEALPRLPDFSSLDFDALSRETAPDAYHGELSAFRRLLTVVGASDDLSLPATPGLSLPSSRVPSSPKKKRGGAPTRSNQDSPSS